MNSVLATVDDVVVSDLVNAPVRITGCVNRLVKFIDSRLEHRRVVAPKHVWLETVEEVEYVEALFARRRDIHFELFDL